MMVVRLIIKFSTTISGCTYPYCRVFRLTAAVYEALGPILEEIQKDIGGIKSSISTLSEKVGNLTKNVEQQKHSVEAELSHVNEKMDRLQSTVDSIDIRMNNNSNPMGSNALIHSDLISLDSRLSSLNYLMRDDFK